MYSADARGQRVGVKNFLKQIELYFDRLYLNLGLLPTHSMGGTNYLFLTGKKPKDIIP